MNQDGSADSAGFSESHAGSQSRVAQGVATSDAGLADNPFARRPFGPPWSSSGMRLAQTDRVRPERVLGLSAALIVHGLLGFWLLLARPSEPPDAVTAPAMTTVFVDMSTPVIAPPPPVPQPPEETKPPPTPVEPEPVTDPVVLPDPPTAIQAITPTTVTAQPVAAPATAIASTPTAPAATQPAAAIDLTGVQSGPLNEWQITLLRHLHKHLRYPLQARRRHQQGVTLVRFVIDRGGRLHSALLEDSSGHDLLDEEALAVLARAQPLPPPPASVAGTSIEIVVPISYRLRRS